MLQRSSEAWPPDYVAVFADRQRRLRAIREKPDLRLGMIERYRDDPIAFIEHWCCTYDPRNAGSETPTTMPFILFDRQREFVDFLLACVKGETDGLVEKCRDMGATWVACAFSVWLWLFWPGAAVGWGSRKEQLVDKIGVPDSIFEKMRMIVRNLPRELIPAGFVEDKHMTYMRLLNPENDAQIVGESGDNIGRGGRTLVYFKDESAHYERPEKIEAALADNTRCQIDISSVNGLGNVFHRRRESGVEWTGEIAKGQTNVFVMDWTDHPAKSEDWYRARKAKAEREGLLHIFAQEIDRDYAASVEGVIIPAEWIKSAIDADAKLGIEITGGEVAGLDVADEGRDRNALVKRRGIRLYHAEEWGERDTGATTRKALDAIGHGPVDLQYDCIGVGAGVKAEINRLRDEGKVPRQVGVAAWNAASGPRDGDSRLIPGDIESPLVKDFYANLKAQGWWELRLRFERTHRAVTEGVEYDPDDLISIDSKMPMLRTVEKELSQPFMKRNTAMKLLVDKTPEGTRSPNIADAIVMAYWPMPVFKAVSAASAPRANFDMMRGIGGNSMDMM